MGSLDELRTEWMNCSPEAYTAMANKLPRKSRARFAAVALEFCLDRLPGQAQLFDIVRIGKNPEHWDQAHVAFDRLRRDVTLKYEAQSPRSDDPCYALLFVGENAARVIYNATSPADPFDDDSAEWLFRVLANLAKVLNAQDLADRVWRQFLETLESDEGYLSRQGALPPRA